MMSHRVAATSALTAWGLVLLCWGAAGTAQVAPAAEPAAAAPATEARTVTVAATGDLLLHIKVVQTARASGWDRVFEGIREASRPSDITFANLETPLVEDVLEVRTGSPPVLGAPATALPALVRAGVDVLGTSNNHAYDQQSSGLRRTVEAGRAEGLVMVGADVGRDAASAPAFLERDGLRVAFLHYTRRINRGPGERPPEAYVATLRDEERFDAALTTARAQAEVVVLGVHWSHDFVERPSHWQRRMARRWIDAGVDVILGTGPHVLQEVEILESPRGQAVVAYSLGNAVSNQGQRYRVGRRPNPRVHPALMIPGTRDAVMLRVQMAAPAEGRVTVASLEATPLWTDNNFWRRHAREESEWDVRVRRLAAMDDPTQTERLPAIQAALGDAVRVVP